MTGWLGGVAVRRMEKGRTPVADFLCTACGTHRRVTGRQLVRDFIELNPISAHQAVCTGTPAPQSTISTNSREKDQ